MYLEQYGGSADVGIGKVLYRTNLFSNDMYLKVAKADFSKFQRLCRLEWHSLKRWCGKNNLEMYGVTRHSALRAYFLAAASNFEPSRAAERLAWARTAVLAEAISGCLLMSSNTHDDRTMTAEWLVDEFVNSDDDNPASGRGKKNSRVTSSLGYALRDLLDIHASDNASVFDCLRGAWKEWFMAWTKTEREGPRVADTAMLLVRTVEICSGRHHSTEQDMKLLPDYSKLEQLTRSICCRLATEAPALNGENMDKIDDLDRMVGFEMQELTQCVSRAAAPSTERHGRRFSM
ncbi:ent-copalyl diphosphate synthase 2-like [Miscanthus floridulus]|uniref:ent-copalyl diphosphate synthase 2-like n=1 Tax=Miscanthus floridulus TaxID=154761 RepID=UPI0034575B7C